MPGIAVIGTGVLGSCIGWRLAEAGHRVTFIDPTPGGKASTGSLAWLNACSAEDPVYNRLRHDSLGIWRALKTAHHDLPIAFSGAILWEQPHFNLPEIEAGQRVLGRPAEMLDRAGHLAREPDVPAPPDRTLALDGDGYGNPLKITGWFLDRAKAAGADVVEAAATAVEVVDGHVTGVHTSDGFVDARHVVAAAGVDLPALLAPHGAAFAMDNQAGLLVTTSPVPASVGAMLATDGLHGWQGEDGRFLIGADFGGGAGFGDPDAFAEALVGQLGALVPAARGCSVERVTIRERPMPADGRPAIGPAGPEGLYVVCTHSGMTLAPVIGEMVAAEIGGTPDPRLDPYRPGRAALH